MSILIANYFTHSAQMFAMFNAFKTLGMSLILILGAVITTQGDFAWFYSAMGAFWVLA